MNFDYITVPDRRGKDAIAVDITELNGFRLEEVIKPEFDRIPMWVADMNFVVPSCITDRIAERLSHPSFGYYSIREEYYKAIIDWHRIRHGVNDLTAETIGYENGLLGGIVSSLKVLLPKGGKVLLHTPAYIGFTHVLNDNHYEIISSELKKDAEGIWRMDLSDMEEKIQKEGIRVAIFCSPHNPTGRVWSREELEAAANLFEKYGVTVISDEIWSDLILSGFQHIPFASVSEYTHENTIELYAPSKTFNLAGLIGSYHIIYNESLRERIDTYEAATSYNHMNVLSMYALMGAYSEAGAAWLEGLLKVLQENVDLSMEFFHGTEALANGSASESGNSGALANGCASESGNSGDLANGSASEPGNSGALAGIDGISVARPQGSYMLFLDCKEYCNMQSVTLDELLRKGMEVGVLWQDGRPFGGSHTIRMNLASPTIRIKEAFRRLFEYVF